MTYKKYTIIALCTLYGCLLSVALINIVVDPFYIFRTPFFRVQTQINDRHAKIEFLEKNKSRFDSYILGSSRMYHTRPHMIEKYIPTGKFYNFATAGATMYEHLLHITYFLKNGYLVKNLYVGLDVDMCFTETIYDEHNYVFKLHPAVSNRKSIDFYWSYLSIFPKRDIKRKLNANLRNKARRKFALEADGTMPWESEPGNPPVFIEGQAAVNKKIAMKKESVSGNLSALREMVALCRKHHIHLVFFITPYHKKLMDRLAGEDYITFLKDLSEITLFWDFSGYNTVTTDNKNYLEISHYKSLVSHLIAARIFNDRTLAVPKDFGTWVTKENIDSHLRDLKASFKN